MTISLDIFLRTGSLGDLRRGMSKEEVQALLDPPEAIAGAACKYPRASLFLCGTVELWFQERTPYDLTDIFWEAGDKGLFYLTEACIVDDWAFTPD